MIQKYEELKLPSSLLCPEDFSIPLSNRLSSMELLMLCHVFSPEEPGRSSSWILEFFTSYDQRPLYTKFLSAERTSSFRNFSSGDTLRKKMSIRAEMLDSRRDVKIIFKACPTFLRSSELSWLAGHFGIWKTRELVARKYYGDLQLLSILTHCRKVTRYDSILVIVDWLTKMVHYKPV